MNALPENVKWAENQAELEKNKAKQVSNWELSRECLLKRAVRPLSSTHTQPEVQSHLFE